MELVPISYRDPFFRRNVLHFDLIHKSPILPRHVGQLFIFPFLLAFSQQIHTSILVMRPLQLRETSAAAQVHKDPGDQVGQRHPIHHRRFQTFLLKQPFGVPTFYSKSRMGT